MVKRKTRRENEGLLVPALAQCQADQADPRTEAIAAETAERPDVLQEAHVHPVEGDGARTITAEVHVQIRTEDEGGVEVGVMTHDIRAEKEERSRRKKENEVANAADPEIIPPSMCWKLYCHNLPLR